MALDLPPTSAKSYISLHPDPRFKDDQTWGLETHLCQWRSQRSSSGCGGTHISVLKTQCKEALNLMRVVAHLKWGGDRVTLLMLYRAIVRSKLDNGCIVYGTASNTNLRQLDGIHNTGLRLALGAFCTSPVSSLYTEANEAPLAGGTPSKTVHALLSENPCLHRQSCTSCPARIWWNHKRTICPQAKWERGYDAASSLSHWSQGRGSHGLCWDQCRIGLPPDNTQLSTGNALLWLPRDTTSLKEWANVWSPDRKPRLSSTSIMKLKDHMMESLLMAPKWTREWGQRQSSTAISWMVRQPAARCPKDCQTTAPSLLLRLQPSPWHWTITSTWAQFTTMWWSTLTQCPACRRIEGEDTENPFICHTMNLLWLLSDKGTHVRFCWIPSHCGIEGNERVDQLARETLDHNIDPLANVHHADLKPLVNSYIAAGSNQVGCGCTW